MASSSKRDPAHEFEPAPGEPSPEELEAQQVIDLPPRQALSIVDPGIFGVRVPVLIARPSEQATGASADTVASTGESQI